ncbi:DUF2920 family protein [Brevibacillus formosus]|uniref:DUF2920 family protein n=1 Tax=Brevibacillus TaxID=55080 RepID=UPI000D0F8132|nr:MULTISPECIES: DUF2920 family protein [Brevibacillus]MBG9940486.1 hypothetical protein [Brevibacillus formosus]MED1944680.1 DUF2920 family protein [Brevibacillus formosus]MED1996633.1 DUF2920 family protein [Brevibacillus formosus]MED2081602.1 DUF2920 family protein [Brevibacillus formosus]PSK12388.1 hypothetical protein C7R94_24345 [Brevibacillus sp. NRRL NRS-603]
MAKDYHVNWSAHPNIYNNYSERTFNFYFSEPEAGVNTETGLLLLIAGFGGNANSNVYKKMRRVFADQYNLVTVQCDYFGHEFMQGYQSPQFNLTSQDMESVFTPDEIKMIYKEGFNPSLFLDIASKYHIGVAAYEKLNESKENFNDMGIMQALDNITAICYVIQILKDNNLKFNPKKTIIYGHSHGAYLGYLCNAFAPNLFNLLIDNSSWLFPVYLKGDRHLYSKIGNMLLDISFKYIASTTDYDAEILHLPTLYKKFNNQCEIQSFHGTTDNLISHINKQRFCTSLANCTYHEISDEKLDGTIFQSTNHGLDSDFLALFDYVMKNMTFVQSDILHLNSTHLKTQTHNYHFDYTSGIPLLHL